jgi:hypothetical protein
MTEEEEEREQPQPHIAPKIDKIADLVTKDGKIDKIEERLQKARSDLGNTYQHIENDLHGHRGAVKQVRKLLAGTTDAAYDFMRTFMRLARHFDLIPEDDLVDMMNSEPPTRRKEGEPGVSTADAAPKSAEVIDHPNRENAIDRAKKAMEGGSKPPAPDGPAGDTDLVEAGEAVAAEIEEQRRKDAEAFDEQGKV